MGSNFSFSRFCDWSPQDLENTHLKGTLYALLKQKWMNETHKWLEHAKTWQQSIPSKYLLFSASVSLAIISLIESNPDLFFTRWASQLFASFYFLFFIFHIYLSLLNHLLDFFANRCRSIHFSHFPNTLSIRWARLLSTG